MAGRRGLDELVAQYGSLVREMRPSAKSPTSRPGGRAIRAELRSLGHEVSEREAFDLARWWPESPGISDADADADDEPTEEVERPEAADWKVEVDEDEDGTHVNVKGQALVMCLEDLIRVARIDLAEHRVERHRVNTWTTAMKDADGRPQIVRNWQVRADLVRRMTETAQVVRPVAPLPRRERPAPERPDCTLLVPDSQHGFRWSEDRTRLIPLHDRLACDLVVQVASRLQPDTIVLLGDMLDLAEWSTRYPRPAELRDTTQPALAEVHAWIASIRQAAPAARIVYVEGNHEQRIQRALVEASSPAAGLRAVGDDEPVLSVPRLLALDAVDVEYVGPYGSDFYLHEQVRICHGDKVRQKGGATAQAVIGEATHSTWYGHVHRVELVHRTLHGPDGPHTIHAGSPGCLCRVDGTVPGVTARPDWQQGVGLLWWDGRREHAEVRTIHDGRLVWDGVELVGEERGAEWAAATGWGQVA